MKDLKKYAAFRRADSQAHTGLTSELIWNVQCVIGPAVKDVEGACSFYSHNGIVSNRCPTAFFIWHRVWVPKLFFLYHSVVILVEAAQSGPKRAGSLTASCTSNFKDPSMNCRTVKNYTQWWTFVNFVNVFLTDCFELSTEKTLIRIPSKKVKTYLHILVRVEIFNVGYQKSEEKSLMADLCFRRYFSRYFIWM